MEFKYKTFKSVLFADKVATWVITTVGLGVIVTVLGLMIFLVQTVIPLGYDEKFELPKTVGEAGTHFAILKEKEFPVELFLAGRSDSCQLDLLLNGRKNSELHVSLTEQTLKLSQENSGRHRCLGLQNSHLFFFKENTAELLYGQLEFNREYLDESQALTLDASIIGGLSKNSFISHGGFFYFRPSRTAPISKLVPSIKTIAQWELPQDALLSTASEWENLQILVKPVSETAGTITTRRGNALVEAFSYSTIVNEITEETSSSVSKVYPDESSTPAINLIPVFENEFWAFAENGTINRGPSEATVKGFNQFQSVIHVYGGNVVFIDDGKGKCGVIDATLAARSHPKEDGNIGIDPNWVADCDSGRTILASSPAARLVVRANLDTRSITAFETTTGRIAIESTFAKAFSLDSTNLNSLSFSDNGHFLLSTLDNVLIATSIYAPHLEASTQSFFGKVKYESYDEPSYSWQSTSATEDFEPKLSLVPLIFGTLKATFYAMFLAVPLGIFAAVYSSEVLDRQTRNFIKPTVEMMASVPSVVLGFLAAIVIAPWVENHALSVVLTGFTMPFTLYLVGSLLSSYSAKHISARGMYASRRVIFLVIFGVAVCLYLLVQAGLILEKTAFGGDLKAFLVGGPGSGAALWGVLLFPLCIMALWNIPSGKYKKVYHFLTFVIAPFISFAIGLFITAGPFANYNLFGNDLLSGTYAQRNTLVISIAIGFAIIPIIYSIAEDALTAVPGSLRAASLACGASVWQTVSRVILPTAASGIFSAIMVGLGRAIGETMIVVMAAGNTAVMNFTPFEGLRSLSANIAVELPEAPQGGTHYRTLFLTALILFIFTFVLNSVAEFLRAKYRERNKAL